MTMLDRSFALRFSARAGMLLLLVFISLLVFAWWWQVLRFFFYDHWRPTSWVVGLCLGWYSVGRAIEQFSNRNSPRPGFLYDNDDGA